MKFRLLEDAVSVAKDRKFKNDSVADEVRIILSELGFEEETQLNGVAFSHNFSSGGIDYNCQFYMDMDAGSYSSYITSITEDEESVTFQQKGSLRDATKAVDKFLTFMNTI